MRVSAMAQLPDASSVEMLFALLSGYLREDGARSKAGLDQYVEWLRTHGHAGLADQVCSNASVADSLNFLMEQHHS
jgi:hypothetical protein